LGLKFKGGKKEPWARHGAGFRWPQKNGSEEREKSPTQQFYQTGQDWVEFYSKQWDFSQSGNSEEPKKGSARETNLTPTKKAEESQTPVLYVQLTQQKSKKERREPSRRGREGGRRHVFFHCLRAPRRLDWKRRERPGSMDHEITSRKKQKLQRTGRTGGIGREILGGEALSTGRQDRHARTTG